MSIEEYYKQMNVVHERDCLICTFQRRETERTSYLGHVWGVFWGKWYSPYILAVALLITAYVVAVKSIYVIVGGL